MESKLPFGKKNYQLMIIGVVTLSGWIRDHVLGQRTTWLRISGTNPWTCNRNGWFYYRNSCYPPKADQMSWHFALAPTFLKSILHVYHSSHSISHH